MLLSVEPFHWSPINYVAGSCSISPDKRTSCILVCRQSKSDFLSVNRINLTTSWHQIFGYSWDSEHWQAHTQRNTHILVCVHAWPQMFNEYIYFHFRSTNFFYYRFSVRFSTASKFINILINIYDTTFLPHHTQHPINRPWIGRVSSPAALALLQPLYVGFN